MSTKKKTNRKRFSIVVLGLFLLIGLIAGGTYVLDEQGLISAGGEVQDGPLADMAELEEGAERPSPPDHEGDEGAGFNSQSLAGLFTAILQISVVVVVIAGGQWLLSWLQRRRRRAPAHSG
jgi:hypothetical protein